MQFHRFSLLIIYLLSSSLLLAKPAYAELPPRPTVHTVGFAASPAKAEVAPLVLATNNTQNGLWAVVQWQDAQGNWQDVSSWSGPLVNGSTIWWVEQKDFGKGPFRWAILQGEKGAITATSQPFHLPAQARKQTTVEVTVQ